MYYKNCQDAWDSDRDTVLCCQLLRPTANALDVGACNCPVVFDY